MICEEKIGISGFLIRTWKNKFGQLHRDSGPAFIVYHKNGNIKLEEFFTNGCLNREDGPARISYYSDGSIQFKIFMSNNLRSRKDGCATLWYNGDGSVAFENYYLYGKYLGKDKKGFWALWDSLNEEERKNLKILNMLSIYS
jgi:antitoxin component YwqK of YwqJK toxin-antitoxin module